jgi:hypothetical protein
VNPPHYDLRLNDGTLRNCLGEEEIAQLMRSGQIDRHSPCTLSGSGQSRTVDDVLPLLKWQARSSLGLFPAAPQNRASNPRHPASAPPAGASPIRAGWICFGLGLGIAWIFSLAHVFYSVAIVLAVVALCRHSPRHGLTLLICSLLGIGISAAISLVVGASLLASIARSVRPPPPPAVASQHQPSPLAVDVEKQFPRPSANTRNLALDDRNPQTAPTAKVRSNRSNLVASPQLPRPAEEVTIQLGEWQSIRTRYGSLRVKIIDHGPATFSVWINGASSPRRLDKIKGFETTGTNLTPIASLSGADVYYVDRISVSPIYCVLKVVPRG